MKQYTTPESALADLQKRGFVFDLNVQGNCIECEEAFTTLYPGEFSVAEVHRFEEAATVYAIDSKKGLKGIVLAVNGTEEGLLEEKETQFSIHQN